jgi:deoxyribodipyrimidine photo-lyase
MSSPLSAFSSCSRLSSYITYGNISIKQILNETTNRQTYLRENKIRTGWLKSLSSFSSRLRWHCHFIQKLEMQPNLEFTNMVQSFEKIRTHFDKDLFIRWTSGTTGYPMVDACMRSLKSNGWINFRMRAMLVSFASYNLWIDWRKTSTYLSKYFIDYEPGIHFNQFQMQSGVTGINAIRIYNPIKQQIDHDPEAIFVRKWVPELKNVPLEYIQYPHLLSEKMQKKQVVLSGKPIQNQQWI